MPAFLRRLQTMSSVAPAPVPLAVPHSIYLGRGGQQCSPPANRPHPPWPPPDPALAQLSLGLSLLVSTRRCMCCVRVGHPSRDARRRLYAVSHRDTCKQLQAVSPERRSGQPHKTMKGTLRSLQSRPCSRLLNSHTLALAAQPVRHQLQQRTCQHIGPRLCGRIPGCRRQAWVLCM